MANNEFGNVLRQLRIARGFSERQLAVQVGVSVSYISKIENGVCAAPSAKTILEIASILKADATELMNVASKIPHEIWLKSRERAIKIFGPKLKDLREKSGMSQLELAKQINVDPSYISKLEKGKMPPPSRKILLQLAKALKISKSELFAISGKAPYVAAKKKGMSQVFGDVYRSIKKNVSLPNLSPSMNKGWVRVAISILLVVGIASSLWLASPTPVQALTIDVTHPSTATIGSPFQITVLVTVESADILPIQSAYLDIQSSTSPGTYKARCTNLPLTNGTSTSISALGTSGTKGTVSVAALTGSNWGYGYTAGSRSGYGYGYGIGWGTHNLGTGYGYGYGYGGAYTGGATTITYTVNWTPPSDWPTGATYEINVFVIGSGAVSFTNPTATTFTLNAAAPAAAPPAPPPAGGDGEGRVTSKEYVSDIVDKTGKFTSPATLCSADGRACIEIPKGTVGLIDGEPLSSLAITPVSPPAPPPGYAKIGLNFDFEPSGAIFDPPIFLTFEYHPNWLPPGATPDNLTIMYYDEDTGRWVELGAEDIEIDPATNTITARVSHFTIFSVMTRISPAAFEVSGLVVPTTTIGIAEKATISAMVKNTGDLAGTTKVTLKINGVEVGSKSVKLAGGEMRKVSFTTVQGKAGSYKVEIDGLTATFTVKAVAVAPIVIAPSVPQVVAPSVEYLAPTAPAAPPAPTLPAPEPTPWLAIILSLVVAGIVAGVLVWYYGYRREYY